MTTEQWYKNPSFSQELAELLKNPTLAAALDICRDQELKSIGTPTGLNLVDYYAIMGAKKVGYLEYLTNLRSLAQPKPPERSAQKAWSYDEQPAQESK